MTEHEKKITSAVGKVLPAVISITIAKEIKDITKDLPLQFFRLPHYQEFLEHEIEHAPKDEKGRIKIGGGSGFFVSEDGIILTNRHVVMDKHATYDIGTSNGKAYEAEVVARDPINDVAILKITSQDKVPFINIGSTDGIILGQSVIAVGNALGEFQNTVSTGVVSGLARFISAAADMMGHQERLRGLIQTDAAINPGNSGGPLVNLDGDAIGINVAVVFGAQNIGFAIPIEKARRDLEEVKKFGRIRRPFLGVRYLLLNKFLRDRFNLPIDHGALIVNEGIPGDLPVIPNSPAAKAGLEEFDVIIKCNDREISEKETLEDLLSQHEIGDQVDLIIFRKGKEETVKISLEEYHKDI
ncbi:trypsin-like peptidase domain-containing protein [Candidatus Giovannonibacteria bacterium]|nr:trypsin-like peptidase domain-containing protein [Candidatus Giovannonibacteria bacterium]